MNVRELAQQQLDYVVALRRHFHANPELAYQEFATTERIAEELTAMGIPFTRLPPTGLVGEISGARPRQDPPPPGGDRRPAHSGGDRLPLPLPDRRRHARLRP